MQAKHPQQNGIKNGRIPQFPSIVVEKSNWGKGCFLIQKTEEPCANQVDRFFGHALIIRKEVQKNDAEGGVQTDKNNQCFVVCSDFKVTIETMLEVQVHIDNDCQGKSK